MHQVSFFSTLTSNTALDSMPSASSRWTNLYPSRSLSNLTHAHASNTSLPIASSWILNLQYAVSNFQQSKACRQIGISYCSEDLAAAARPTYAQSADNDRQQEISVHEVSVLLGTSTAQATSCSPCAILKLLIYAACA